MTEPESPAQRRADVSRYRANLQDEVDGAAVYAALADVEANEQLAGVYARLAAVERRHGDFWAEQLRQAGVAVGPPRPSWRARLLSRLARRFGTSVVAPAMASAEADNRHMYDDQPEAAGTSLAADERSHARLLRAVTRPGHGGLEGGAIGRLEGRHRGASSGNALRAAVLGANDGLVSNLSLVLGVAGSGLGGRTVAVTGLAGLLAGAGSMALGEWISVRSAQELAERQLEVERDELEAHPDEEREELRLIYEAKGIPPEEARRIADRIFAEPGAALDVMAREEIGVDPSQLGGSPWQAAAVSFVLFALGAAVPVLPFLALPRTRAVVVAVVASGAALWLLGAAITLFTGRSALRTGLRQVVVGLAAGAVTYGAGAALGVTLG